VQLKFERGEKIRLDGKTLKFTYVNGHDEAVFEEMATGKVYQLLERDILEKYLAKGITLNVTDDGKGDPILNTDFSAYPQEHQEEAERRKAYCDAVLDAKMPRPQGLHWPLIIARAAPLAKDLPNEVPSYLTVRTWLRVYIASGHDIRSLIPRHCRKGRKATVRGDEEQSFLDSLLLRFEKEERPSKAKWVRTITQEYTKAKAIGNRTDWKCPSKRAIYRLLDKSNARLRTKRRFGDRAAVAKFDHHGITPEALFPMEVVEIDHTWLDIHVVDKKYGITLGRPWVTAAIDRYTRMLVGIYIGFEPPSIYSVCQCIKNMVLPKTHMDRLYKNLPMWEAYGVPVLIVCDNGREFISQGYKDVAVKLKTTIRLAPVKNPEYKGKIERFLKTINESGLSGLPGVSFPNPKERGDYPAEERARLTLEDLREYLVHWLMAEYVWKRHEGINRVPGAYWRESLPLWKPRLTNSVEELEIILSRADKATHRDKKGVVFKGIWYNSPKLEQLFEMYADQLYEVDLRINDGDLGYINVIHPKHPVPIKCKARNFDYADGLSLYHHIQIQKAYRRKSDIDESSTDAVKSREAFHRLVEKWILTDTAKFRKHIRRSRKNTEQPSAASEASRPDFASSEEANEVGEEMMGAEASEAPNTSPSQAQGTEASEAPNGSAPQAQDADASELPNSPESPLQGAASPHKPTSTSGKRRGFGFHNP
jgi:putative transposase